MKKTKITLYEEDKKEEASMRCSLLHGSWDQILRRHPFAVGVRMISGIVFTGFKFFLVYYICITWVKIWDGIEYEHYISLVMWLGHFLHSWSQFFRWGGGGGGGDISPGLCWILIFVFFSNFLCFSEWTWVLAHEFRCPDDNLNCFDWISMIFSIYVIWVNILDGNEYQHHT